jgi:hypothetical protein
LITRWSLAHFQVKLWTSTSLGAGGKICLQISIHWEYNVALLVLGWVKSCIGKTRWQPLRLEPEIRRTESPQRTGQVSDWVSYLVTGWKSSLSVSRLRWNEVGYRILGSGQTARNSQYLESIPQIIWLPQKR